MKRLNDSLLFHFLYFLVYYGLHGRVARLEPLFYEPAPGL